MLWQSNGENKYMSRTRRRNAEEHKTYYSNREEKHITFGNTEHRDKKEGNKPPGWFKRMRQRLRRKKLKQAIRENKEALPKFKHDDQWHWT